MLVLTILNSFEVVYEVCRRVVCKNYQPRPVTVRVAIDRFREVGE